ncbi:MAG: dUTP diphosphatase, partial [Clostridia bacterium]|nr:dUTP diphosphatase [Clostridia bacterium]
VVPTYGSACAAGADLYALIDNDKQTIAPHQTVIIHTGIALAIPDGYAGMIFARSGIALKRGLAPANKVGVIDSDYRGEIMVAIHNHSDEEKEIANGERIAQLVIMPYLAAEFCECSSLDTTQRNDGGFGSTGTK